MVGHPYVTARCPAITADPRDLANKKVFQNIFTNMASTEQYFLRLLTNTDFFPCLTEYFNQLFQPCNINVNSHINKKFNLLSFDEKNLIKTNFGCHPKIEDLMPGRIQQ